MLDENNVAFLGLETGFLGKNDPFRKRNAKPIRDGAEPYSGNVFYYWFQFLKLHQEFVGLPTKGPSAKIIKGVYDEFDVGPYEDFYVWWMERGRHIFGGSSEDSPKAEGPLTAEEFAEKKDGIGIFFPFDGDIEAMLVQAEKHFRAARAAFYERDPSQKPPRELWGTKHKTVSLHNKLVIYRAVMVDLRDAGTARDPRPFWRIFDEIADQLDLSTMEKRRKSKPGYPNEAITPESLAPQRIGDWMTDNFDEACKLVYHVARGEFPKTKAPQGPYNPRKKAGQGY